MRILVIDDEPTVRLAIAAALRQAQHTVLCASDGAEGLDVLGREDVDVVLTDMRMPGMSGLDVLTQVRARSPLVDVVLMSAFSDTQAVVKSLQVGAADYLSKPLDRETLVRRLDRVGERRELQASLRAARAQLRARDPAAFMGDSPAIRHLLGQIDAFAPSDAPVFIQGETGTGKELLARRVHALSDRPHAAFVPVNCAALPETLIEAELFGAERGAYTGAVNRRVGRFSAADGGTLFLDEVAELPLTAQAKLLRALQEGTIEPLGSDRVMRVDVRVISATHRDLKAWVADGRFREDLYYRLNVLSVTAPPLRRHRTDLVLLVAHFLDRYGPDDREITLSMAAWRALRAHRFPGNVRELEHAIRYALVLSAGRQIDVAHLPDDIAGRVARQSGAITTVEPREAPPLVPLREAAAAWERAHLIEAVARLGGRRSAAAAALGISRKSLWHKLKTHGVTKAEIAKAIDALDRDHRPGP